MQNLGGIGKRSAPLAFWQGYLAQIDGQTIGICGLYQQPDTPPEQVWVGWLGIRPRFRWQGLGSQMLKQLKEQALSFGFQTFWVFTDVDNQVAISFYQKAGFEEMGAASSVCPEATHDLTDVVLRCNLRQ